jgi:D-hexose-6-phosphate mutarotase
MVAKHSKPRFPDLIEAAAVLGGASPSRIKFSTALEAYWQVSDANPTS